MNLIRLAAKIRFPREDSSAALARIFKELVNTDPTFKAITSKQAPCKNCEHSSYFKPRSTILSEPCSSCVAGDLWINFKLHEDLIPDSIEGEDNVSRL